MNMEEITYETRQKKNLSLWHDNTYSSRDIAGIARVYASCEDHTDEVAYALCKKINEKPHTYMDAIHILMDANYI